MLNERGSTLVTVLVVTLILLIFGTTLISVGMNDVTQAVRHEKKIEAYYLARSGADAVAAHLLQNPGDIDDFLAMGEDEFELANGRCVVRVVEQGEDIVVESTGHVSSYSDTVKVSLFSDSSMPNLDMAVFAETTLELEGSAVIGVSGTNSVEPGSVKFTWSPKVDGDFYVGVGGNPNEVIDSQQGGLQNIVGLVGNLDEVRTYPLPPFPQFPSELNYYGDFLAGWWPSPPHHIFDDWTFDELRVQSHLIIDVGHDVRRIRARKLVVEGSGAIELVGSGQLELYIEEEFILSGGGTINQGGDPNQIMLYYKGSQPIGPPGNTRLYGCLYSESADIVLQGSGGILGSIITGGSNVSLEGSTSALVRTIYAPNADVVLSGSSTVYGSVIGNSFVAVGNSRVYFEPDQKWEDIPLPSGNSGLKRGHWKRN
ncbi:MAG: hypothetical protein FH749_05495 [Firmicutes bacterium]|nr:hypothetical protein [Bacillota bacterium]